MATSPLRDQVSYRQNAQPGAKELAVLNEDAGQFVRGVRSSADQMSAGSYADDALDAELGGKQAAVETALRRHSALQQRAAETGPRVQRASDINSVGDLGDWAAGTLGSAAATMAPSVAGALLLRRAGKIGSFGGAYAPAYAMERNEAISNQYNDPEQLKASAQERSNVAAAKGGVNAALESIVPAGIGGALFRKPVGSFLGGVGRSVATEAATEAAQEGTGFLAQKHLNQSKEFNPVDILDAAAAGAVGGGGMSMAGQAPGRLLNAVTPTGAGGALDAAGNAISGAAGSVRDAARAGVERFGPNGTPDPEGITPDGSPEGPAGPSDTLGGKFGDLASAVAARAAPSVDRAAEGAKKMGEKASTAAGAALDRMTEATKTAETPSDFVRQVFSSSLEDQAADDLNPTSPDALRGATEGETGANMARDAEDRTARAARFADDLMTDPATPQSVRDRIEAMEGNFEDEGNRAFLSRSLVAMRGGQKLRSAVDRAAEALKGLSKTTTELGKAAAAGVKEGASSAVDSTVDRVVKKNLQSATEAENNAFGKVIFDNLTDAAKTDGYVRAQLAQVTNAVMAFAAKTGDMTESDMKALTRMADVMTLFKDPDAMLEQLVEYGALPRTSDSFLSRIKAVTSAQQDAEQANSFLLSSITPEVMDDMKGPELKELARVVDSFGNDSMSKEQSDQLIAGLGHVFGTPENARVVLDYYYKQNRANLRFDPNEGESANTDQDAGRTPRSSDDMSIDELEGFGKLTEQDSSELRPRFRTPNPNRPFLKGRDDAALQEAVGKAGDLAQVASMLDYVRGNDDINAKFAAGDIRRDLAKRLNGHLARDEASLQEAIGMYEAHLEEVEGTEDANEVRSMLFALKNKLKTAEDRSSIVKPLQEEIKAQERAMSEALKAGKDPDEALLELYSVVMASKSDHAADDGQMRKFRELLDRTSGSQSAAAKENNALIRKTSVPLMVNGNKTAVSLESMIYNSPVQGSLVERLMASMSLVAGRADTLPVVPADAIVKRDYYGKGQHLTWGGLKKLSPKFRTEERRTEPKKRKQSPEAAQTAAEVRAMRDEVSASGMRNYLKTLPADVDGLEVGVSMLSRVERVYDATSAEIAAYESEDQRVPSQLFEKMAQIASKRRILRAFVKENLDSDFPVDRETLIGGLDTWRQEDGIVDKAEDKTEHDNILLAEAQMDAYRARYRAVKGTSFAKEFYGKAKELADELDNKLSRTVDFKRMSVEDRPSGRPNSIRTSKTADPKAADQTRADLVAELDRVKAQSEKDFRAFVEPDSFSEAQAEQKKLGMPAYNAKYNKLAAQYKAERVKRIQETLDRSAPRPKAEPAGERVVLPKTSGYVAKDQAKSDKANKFIGQGSERSSTNGYAKAWGDRANSGKYVASDAVFVSAEGNRAGRVAPNLNELQRAMDAGATVITDDVANRQRPYNLGEREVASYLANNGYSEDAGSGIWTRTDKESKVDPLRGAGAEMVFGLNKAFDAKAAAASFRKIVRDTIGDVANVVVGNGNGAHLQSARFDVSSAGAEISLFLDNFVFSEGTPEEAAHHEAAHAVVQIVQQVYGRDVAKKLVDLVDKQYIREQISELTGFAAGYFQTSPEELFTQTYALWASGKLKLKAEPRLRRIFNSIKELLGKVRDDQLLADIFASISDGDFRDRVTSLSEQAFAERMDSSGDFFTYNKDFKVTEEAVQELVRHLGAGANLDPAALMDKEIFLVAKAISFASGSRADRLEAIQGIVADAAKFRKKSAMGPIRGNATSVMTREEKARIVAEIVRMRGADIRVAFAKYAAIGGSGDFSMNPDRTERLIRIAISSMNPTSVAWHESLHDFFSMLGNTKEERALKDSLLKAADDPFVIEKLKNLLKGHPAAVDQVTVDPEERLAYMFQFWAEGALELKPAVSNKFTRFMQFIRDMLGIVTADQKTDAVFQALFDGRFAEQSLVPAVLADMKLDTLGDKLTAVSGPLGVMASNAMTGATDRLRKTHVPALVELADMFHREPGRETGARTFMQERAQTVGKRLNQLQKILENTSSEDRARAIENMQAMRAPSSPLERQLAAYLEEMRGYMNVRGVKQFNSKTKKWVPMKRVNNYFPRVWDKNAIRNNEAGFMALMEPHIGRLQARATYEALINGDGSLELAESEHSLGFTPWNPAVLDRQFTFINPSNAADFAAFQSKDLASIMTSYTQRGIHRAEYASFFGNNGETITKKFLEAQRQGATTEDLAMARKATMALEGTLGYDTNPQLKELMAGIMTYQNILLLPLSLFTNLVDPLGIALKSGDMKEAWHAFTYGIKGLVDQVRGAGPDAQTEIAMMLGIVDEQNMLDAMGQVYNSMHMSSFMKKINNKFFRYNGMEMWNQRMRVAAMGAAERFILTNMEVLNRRNALADPFHPRRSTEVASEKVLADAKRYLDELGITSRDVVLTPDGRLSLTKEQFEASGMSRTQALESEKRIQAAMFKWVDGAVLRPNAAHRPIWGSDPRFQLVMHLKQFTFSFQNVILRRVGEDMKHGNMAPGFILASYVPFMFAADVLKGSLTGTVQTTSDLFTVASASIGRSGILGTGIFGSDAVEDVHRGNLPGTSFAGPAFSHLMTLLNGLMGRGSMEQVLDRSVPFTKYF